jgi:hypothetical protein
LKFVRLCTSNNVELDFFVIANALLGLLRVSLGNVGSVNENLFIRVVSLIAKVGILCHENMKSINFILDST